MWPQTNYWMMPRPIPGSDRMNTRYHNLRYDSILLKILSIKSSVKPTGSTIETGRRESSQKRYNSE